MSLKPHTEFGTEKARHKSKEGVDASGERKKPCQDRNTLPFTPENFRCQRILIEASPIEDLNWRVRHRHECTGDNAFWLMPGYLNNLSINVHTERVSHNFTLRIVGLIEVPFSPIVPDVPIVPMFRGRELDASGIINWRILGPKPALILTIV